MIIAFTSLTPAGATFMDWSWHWLKGEDQHWNKKHGWSDLTKNPLSKNNSHSHKKNHPCSLEEWNKFIDSAMAENADVSFYPVLLSKNNNHFYTLFHEQVDLFHIFRKVVIFR